MTDPLARLTAALADRYRIERELGQGGMATVYLAHDVKHDRQVAVKVLRPELAAVIGAERFVQEIKTTANLSHPHILPLFDSGTADSFLYYVMPFIDGETLRGKLNRETQLGIEEAVRITREVADALEYAHQHGVVHRDIKPENILLQNGRPMVADFGIALAVSAAAGGRMTETGLSLGTPHYMSPEQATAEKDLTARADIYSLASVLYEMLTGSPPHVGASAQQIIMKIVTDQARPIGELRKSVPPHVAAATAKALEKLPADRFESAAAFSAALANPGFTVAGTTGRGRPVRSARRISAPGPMGHGCGAGHGGGDCCGPHLRGNAAGAGGGPIPPAHPQRRPVDGPEWGRCAVRAVPRWNPYRVALSPDGSSHRLRRDRLRGRDQPAVHPHPRSDRGDPRSREPRTRSHRSSPPMASGWASPRTRTKSSRRSR